MLGSAASPTKTGATRVRICGHAAGRPDLLLGDHARRRPGAPRNALGRYAHSTGRGPRDDHVRHAAERGTRRNHPRLDPGIHVEPGTWSGPLRSRSEYGGRIPTRVDMVQRHDDRDHRCRPWTALNNAEYYWRVRAIDSDGNAGVWNEGPRFTKAFDDEAPTIKNLRLVTAEQKPQPPAFPTTGHAARNLVACARSGQLRSDRVAARPASAQSRKSSATSDRLHRDARLGPDRETPHAGHRPVQLGESAERGQAWKPAEGYSISVAARQDRDASWALRRERTDAAENCGVHVTFKYVLRGCISARTEKHSFESNQTRAGSEEAQLRAASLTTPTNT